MHGFMSRKLNCIVKVKINPSKKLVLNFKCMINLFSLIKKVDI